MPGLAAGKHRRHHGCLCISPRLGEHNSAMSPTATAFRTFALPPCNVLMRAVIARGRHRRPRDHSNRRHVTSVVSPWRYGAAEGVNVEANTKKIANNRVTFASEQSNLQGSTQR
jgi:hypothetical protein